jgi:hypothetical protein
MNDLGNEPENSGRRELLQLAGIFTGLSVLGLSPGTAMAAGQDGADFIAVSKALVGRQDLSSAFGDALLAAFRKIDPSFDGKLARLRKLIGDSPMAGDALKTSLASAPDVAGLPQTILTGWYLGIAGSGEKAICVAYVDALANREVADVLRPQSYSYGAYGSWASKPA